MTEPKDAQMTDTLVERLRAVDVSWSETGEWCAEAADRIIALEAELKTVLDREADTHRRHDAKVDALEAEMARRDKSELRSRKAREIVDRLPAILEALTERASMAAGDDVTEHKVMQQREWLAQNRPELSAKIDTALAAREAESGDVADDDAEADPFN